jgi:hypothetical protein
MNHAERAEDRECRPGGEILDNAHQKISSLEAARRWLWQKSAQAVREKLSEAPTVLKRASQAARLREGVADGRGGGGRGYFFLQKV